MTPVLLLVFGVAASEAVADLWHVVRRGPATYGRLLGRLLGEAGLRSVALVTWISVTTSLAFWRAPEPVAWTALWSSVALGLAPLLLSGIGVAPYIGPLVYMGLHGWTVFQLGARLQVLAGLSMLDGVVAVLAGGAGYWLCRALRWRWQSSRRGSTVLAGGQPCR